MIVMNFIPGSKIKGVDISHSSFNISQKIAKINGFDYPIKGV
jgi:hypothetical protein